MKSRFHLKFKRFFYQKNCRYVILRIDIRADTFLSLIIDYQFVNPISIFSGNRESNRKCYMKNIEKMITIITNHYQTFFT